MSIYFINIVQAECANRPPKHEVRVYAFVCEGKVGVVL